jgi:hypothetical protein
MSNYFLRRPFTNGKKIKDEVIKEMTNDNTQHSSFKFSMANEPTSILINQLTPERMED